MTIESGLRYLFTVDDALADPLVRAGCIGIAAIFALAFAATFALRFAGLTSAETHRELLLRTYSRAWLAVIIALAVLLGRGAVIFAVVILSLLAYRDFARATGVFRTRSLSVVAVLGVLAFAFASADRWHRLYFAITPIVVLLLAVVTLPRDEPRGFLQRIGLAITGFILFGTMLGYIGLLTDAPRYRAVLLLMILAVELNDLFACIVGRMIGGPKLLPNTSPGKTLAGSLGAILLTTPPVMLIGRALFDGTPLGHWGALVLLGVALSVAGQLGDLILSSIKRDVGIKDFARAIPGHGGILDRFDSLVLVPPLLYIVISLMNGPLGHEGPTRFCSGAFAP